MIVDRANAALAVAQAVQCGDWTPRLSKRTRWKGSVCDGTPSHSAERGKTNCIVVAAVVAILVIDQGLVRPGWPCTRSSPVIWRSVSVGGAVSSFVNSCLCAWTPRRCCRRKVGRKGRKLVRASRDLPKGGNGRVFVESAVVSVAAQLGEAVIEVSRRLALAGVVSRFRDWRRGQARTAA